MISAHPLYDHFHQHLSESAMQMYGEIGNLKLGIIQFKSLKLRREASEWVLIALLFTPGPPLLCYFAGKMWQLFSCKEG